MGLGHIAIKWKMMCKLLDETLGQIFQELLFYNSDKWLKCAEQAKYRFLPLSENLTVFLVYLLGYTPPQADTPRAHPPRQTPLPGHTPPGRPPLGTHPSGRHQPPEQTHPLPSRRLLLRTVRILLECILVTTRK